MRTRQLQKRHVLAEGDDPLLTPEQKARYRQAAELLRGWMQAEDGYDQEVWPLIEAELKDHRMRMAV
jgi:hypothetical protein